ncbi:MAG: restriction endonuclease subunit S [Anaerovoracaceae bacterium]
MKYKLLKDVCNINMGQSPDSNSYNENGYGVPFFQGNADFGERYPIVKKWCNAPTKMAASEDILISVRAPIGAVNYAKEDCCIGRGLAAITPDKTKVSPEFIFWLLKGKKDELNDKGTGSTFKAIGRTVLEEILIPDIEIEKQIESAAILEKMYSVMQAKHQEISKLDDLVKARFVELFGDPISNSFGLNTKPMTDICEIIDGDRGKNYPTIDDFSDDGYCLFLNAKNVTSDGFNFENCMYITKERDEALRKGRLKRGDVVLTTRGTIGNLAFYTNEIPFEHVRINSGMVILRMKQEVADEVYFIEHFKMQLADIKAKIASGSAQPQLPISTMNKIQILIPEIEQQRDFAAFVEQVDKSKFDKHDNIFTRDKTYEKTTTNPN